MPEIEIKKREKAGFAGPALALSSGLMLALSFPPFGLWPLAWFALVPLWIAVIKAENLRTAANLAAYSGLLFYALSLSWMFNIFHFVALAFWSLFALWLVLHSALLKIFWEKVKSRGEKKTEALMWTVLAGILWAGIEYFRSEVWFLPCPWLGLGYGQTGNSALYQSLSVWGVFGLSAFIASSNAAWTLLFCRHRFPAVFFACLIVLLSVFGAGRLKTFDVAAGKPVKVALVQDESGEVMKLIDLSLKPEIRDAELLVWPENSFFIQTGTLDMYLRLFSRKLSPVKAVFVFGTGVAPDILRTVKRENFALVLDQDKLPGRYDKIHPVPFVDKGLIPGPEPETVETSIGKLGIQICYDLNFEDGTRKLAEKGAVLIVTPTMDPLFWGKWQHIQHSDMSPARAVESGLWVARAATSGISQIIDPLGRITASLESGKNDVLSGKVHALKGGTFYSRYGWTFPFICLMVSVLAVLFTLYVWLKKVFAGKSGKNPPQTPVP